MHWTVSPEDLARRPRRHARVVLVVVVLVQEDRAQSHGWGDEDELPGLGAVGVRLEGAALDACPLSSSRRKNQDPRMRVENIAGTLLCTSFDDRKDPPILVPGE